jgi:hypothetical protein
MSDLASRIDLPELKAVRQIYDVQEVPASKLCMNDAGWAAARAAFGPDRAAVENQVLSIARDRYTGLEAIINSLRARRVAQAPATGVPAVTTAAAAPHCRWCAEWHVGQTGLWAEEWGQAQSADGRIGTRPNWARQSLVSGLAFGDAAMHHLDALTESGFVGLFETGERYLALARNRHPRACFSTLYLNGGPKSAGSVEHGHVQIVARDDQHFAYPEMIAGRCPPDYWQRVLEAHSSAGLVVSDCGCTGWASLVPAKERDFTGISGSVVAGARFMYRVWRALAQHGTRNFSLAAIVSPGYLSARDCPYRFASWPAVVWRFVDRGDPDVRHADIGTMELFASPVIAADPYGTIRAVREG